MADMDEVVEVLEKLVSKFEDSSFFTSSETIYDLLERICDRLDDIRETLNEISSKLDSIGD
jgi:hypothetical protein